MPKFIFITSLFFLISLSSMAQVSSFLQKNSQGHLELTQAGASHLAGLALNCIQQEFPNKTGHVMSNAREDVAPKTLHPAFYGCYDWHSAVHGHWMLVRLLKIFPDLPEGPEIRDVLDENLQAEAILQEKAYFERPNTRSFERTYGWAWLLKLAEELATWEDKQGQKWAKNLQPLSAIIVQRYLGFLPKQTYPIRTGVHPNTAFGLSFALDYARTTGQEALEKLIVQRSLDYYQKDKSCPAAWEPGGNDFFSPCLLEADLMSKVLPRDEFIPWLSDFLDNEQTLNLLAPAEVSDRSDPQIVHLDGLNLSRAWCMLGILQKLPEKNVWYSKFDESAQRHVRATLPNIASGDYAGEHWLASFAVFVLSLNQ